MVRIWKVSTETFNIFHCLEAPPFQGLEKALPNEIPRILCISRGEEGESKLV